jgi:hypothetical protein
MLAVGQHLAEFGMTNEDKGLTNHTITICLEGGSVLGPFRATWSTEIVSDVRELVKEYDGFLKGDAQKRFKFHLHDPQERVSHSLVLDFKRVTAIYDKVVLHD